MRRALPAASGISEVGGCFGNACAALGPSARSALLQRRRSRCSARERVGCATLLCALACSPERGQPWVSDTLALNPEPSAATSRWRLSSQPTLVVGHEGDPRYEFHDPQQAISLSDGRIVVSNARTELRYYDADGRYLLTAGRKGPGPNEFQNLMGIVRLPGDSVAASDFEGTPRMLIFGPDGRFVRSFGIGTGGFQLFPVDGDWIGIPARGHGSRSRCYGTPTHVREPITIARIPSRGRSVKSLGSIDGPLALVIGCSRAEVPFGPQGSYTVGAGWLFTTSGDEHVVERRSLEDGRVVQRRTNAGARPVTADMIEANMRGEAEALAKFRARGGRAEGGSTELHRTMRLPEQLPAIASLHTDALGNLWVRRYDLDWEPEREWWIYDPAGRLVATLRSPANFRISEFGADYVLGLWRDDLDVESVRRFAVVKPLNARGEVR